MEAIKEAVTRLRTDAESGALAELTPGRYANAQMTAFGAFVDTQRSRDRVLEVLAH